MEKLYPMYIAATLLCLVLIYFEIKRDNKARLLFRVLAVVIAIVALLFLIAPLTYRASRSVNQKELVLLTEGATNKLADDSLYYTLDSLVFRKYKSTSVKLIADLPYYLKTHEDVNSLRVYGNGLPPALLKYTKDLRYTFVPGAEPEGIIAASWSNVVRESESLDVLGTYNNTTDQPVKLLLVGSGTHLDSVKVAAHGKYNFLLRSVPRQLGRAVYTVMAFSGETLISSSPVPFEVLPVGKIKVLVLSSSPDFEYKFLKNWLLEAKYPAVFRTRISKDKFSTEQVNLEGQQGTALTTGILKKYDLVIADDDELAQLGNAANAELRNAVAAGLGLLIRFNETKQLSALGQKFQLINSSDTITTSFTPILDESTTSLKPISTGQSLSIQSAPGTIALVRDQKGKIFVNTGLYGNGRLGATVLSSTYNWILSGQKKDYAEYWAYILGKSARKQIAAEVFHVSPLFPVVRDEVNVIFESNISNGLPEIKLNDAGSSVLQNTVLPFYWQSTGWVSGKGWNRFQAKEKAANYFYVYDIGDWKALRAQNLISENRNSIKNLADEVLKARVATEDFEKEVSKWLFFVLFLFSLAYLWFETKML
ncbi:hypothetical protein [Pedobacter duraquae]|uniref:Uncharacterized protein n=1 Tax=Pedobacter duraquae TaxID=425511 RepID=A0A4R6ILC0_9SPHI|nr:hypothetical protein [Pedobacter duraquae]TDO22851.1 hypothetical protein CLV32_1836 [Pedobacter duraquae]